VQSKAAGKTSPLLGLAGYKLDNFKGLPGLVSVKI
jgi:hypothetical protein